MKEERWLIGLTCLALFVLTHPALYGAFVFTRKVDGKIPQPVENYYPPVISKGRWLKLQERIKNAPKTDGGRRRRMVPNLFVGLMKCAECGGAMHIGGNAPEAERHYRYYYCHRHRRAARAYSNGKFWRVGDLEEHVLRYISEDFNPAILMQQTIVPDAHAERITQLQDLVREAQDEIDRAKARILTEKNDRRWDLLMDSITSREDELQAFRNELKDLEQQRAEQQLSPSAEEQGHHLKELAAGMRESDEERARLRAAIERLIDTIEVNCDSVMGFVNIFAKNENGWFVPRDPIHYNDPTEFMREHLKVVPITPKKKRGRPPKNRKTNN